MANSNDAARGQSHRIQHIHMNGLTQGSGLPPPLAGLVPEFTLLEEGLVSLEPGNLDDAREMIQQYLGIFEQIRDVMEERLTNRLLFGNRDETR